MNNHVINQRIKLNFEVNDYVINIVLRKVFRSL